MNRGSDLPGRYQYRCMDIETGYQIVDILNAAFIEGRAFGKTRCRSITGNYGISKDMIASPKEDL